MKWILRLFVLSLLSITFSGSAFCDAKEKKGAVNTVESSSVEEMSVVEEDMETVSIFTRAWEGGVVVFSVLLILVLASVFIWAIIIAKMLHLKKLNQTNQVFAKSFWDSRSLNDLNARLNEYPYSPVKEVFRTGYAELVRGSQLRDHSGSSSIVVNAAIENLGRSLNKARNAERRRMESYLPIIAIIASVSPFVGLFGTVWGIMGAFEGIARTGSASLAAVAPGISEALIATAFGLAAAIPAVIGYNLANAKIRQVVSFIDGFSADFMNIVERYLVSDKSKPSANSTNPL